MFKGLSRRVPALLAVAIAAAVAFSLWETRGQTLFSDEWGRLILAQQDSLRTYLLGYSGHLIVLHALLYRGLFGIFGADSYVPFRVLEALLIGLNGWLFFMLARWRATPGMALAATLPLLFLGSAFEVTATPFGIVVLLPMAFGLGALVCMTRLGRAGDPLACVLLIMSIASLSDGLAFLAGAVVILLLQSGRLWWRRSWVVAVPVVLYVAWYVWAHHNGIPSQAHAGNIQQLPSATLDSAAAGFAAVSGFFGGVVDTGNAKLDLNAGYLLLGLALVAFGVRWREGFRPAREIWVPLAVALAFWALLAMVISPERPVVSSRYLYPSAVFILLIALELFRGTRITNRGALVVGALLALTIVPNVVELNRTAGSIRGVATGERIQLGALELLAEDVPGDALPGLRVQQGGIMVDPRGYFSGAAYLEAVRRFGSPAASAGEIAAIGGLGGTAADQILLKGGDIEVGPPTATLPGKCLPGDRDTPIPPQGLVVRANGRQVPAVEARRFSPAFQRLAVPAQGSFTIRSNADAAPFWLLHVAHGDICRAA